MPRKAKQMPESGDEPQGITEKGLLCALRHHRNEAAITAVGAGGHAPCV